MRGFGFGTRTFIGCTSGCPAEIEFPTTGPEAGGCGEGDEDEEVITAVPTEASTKSAVIPLAKASRGRVKVDMANAPTYASVKCEELTNWEIIEISMYPPEVLAERSGPKPGERIR